MIALIAAALRVVLVLAPPAETYRAGQVLVDGVIVEQGNRVAGEELLRGSATRDFLEGTLLLPHLQDYQVQPFWGGTLVVSVVAMPFFALLGPKIVALRMTGVVFGALAAVLVFWILERCAGRRAAWIGGLLMAVAPAGLTVFGATAYGAEVENQTLCLLTLAAFLAYVHGGLRPRQGFVAGLLAGFTIYCGYIAAPLVALLALYALWLDPRCLRRRATAWAAAGLVVGSWPAIYYNLTHSGGDAFVMYGESLTDHLAPLTRIGRLARHAVELGWLDLPASFYVQQPLRLALGRVVLAVLLCLCCVAALRHRGSLARALGLPWKRVQPAFEAVHPTVLFLAFLPVYAAAYLVTDFRVDHELGQAIAYRYLLPFFPFLFLLAGIALDELAQRSAALRRASIATAAALCTLFLVSNLGYCRFDRTRDIWSRPGYSDVQFARMIMLRFGDDLDALTHISEAIVREKTPQTQRKLFFVVAQNLKYFLHPDTPLDDHYRALGPAYERALAHLQTIVPEPYRPFFEPLAPGERIFGHHEIDEWRRAREIRRAQQPDGERRAGAPR